MVKKFLMVLAAVMVSFVVFGGVQSAAAATSPSKAVTLMDTAELFTVQESAQLKQKLEQDDKVYSAHFTVITVSTLQGKDIEDAAKKQMKEYHLNNNGSKNILLFIDKQERKVRFQYTEAVLKVMSESAAEQVITDTITPAYKQGNFYTGTVDGLQDFGKTMQNGGKDSDLTTNIVTLICILGVIALIIWAAVFIARGPKGSNNGRGGSSYSGAAGGAAYYSSYDSGSSYGGGDGGGASGSW